MAEETLEEKYRRAAGVICRQGMIPFPVNDTTISIMKHVIGDEEDELDLIFAFRDKSSKTMEELKASSDFSEKQIEQLALNLARKGLIFNQPSSAGIMVYRLLPLMNVGLMEYKFMGELKWNEDERLLANLFQKLMDQVRDQVQANYDQLVPMLQKAPPVDRTVPIRSTEEGDTIRIIPLAREVEVPEEFVLPSQSVDEIIDKFDDIAVGHCFCRQRRAVMGEPCRFDAPTFCRDDLKGGSTEDHAGGGKSRARAQGVSSQCQGVASGNKYLQLLQGLL